MTLSRQYRRHFAKTLIGRPFAQGHMACPLPTIAMRKSISGGEGTDPTVQCSRLIEASTLGAMAMIQKAAAELRNQFLRRIGQPDWQNLAQHLEPVILGPRKILDVPGKPINHLYFPEDGVISVVAVNAEDHRTEVGVIGYEGVSGVPVILGDIRAQHSTYMQIPGHGHRIAVDAFKAAMQASESFHALGLKWAHAFMIQTSYTALANGRANIEQRLARWLLMAHDRVRTNQVPLTHEFLAVMLGVRRAGVTLALHRFQERGLVSAQRGRLTVTDRAGIQAIAGSFYGAPESELARLFGADPWAIEKSSVGPHTGRDFARPKAKEPA